MSAVDTAGVGATMVTSTPYMDDSNITVGPYNDSVKIHMIIQCALVMIIFIHYVQCVLSYYTVGWLTFKGTDFKDFLNLKNTYPGRY